MPEKCSWCANETSDMEEIEFQFNGKPNRAKVCSTHCEQELKDFVNYADSHKKHYILWLVLSIVIGLTVTIWRIKVDFGALGVFIIFAGSGLALIKYPFVTPQTISTLGAKKAIASGRFLGWMNIVIGAAFWYFLAAYLA
jgi:hypothetical protein